jgi:putative ABC transport system permease protein
MIKNLFKHSVRALRRQKGYVFINVAGLAIGIACSFVIGLFIIHQLSFDQYHEKKDVIYRVNLDGKIGGQEILAASTTSPLGPAMVRDFPEVLDFLRINNWAETVIKYEDQFFTENYFIEADSSFFSFFSIPLLKGNPETALTEPYTVVISESTSHKMFGDDDPLNKMIRVGTSTSPYMITGIFRDVPENTHFEANMIGSFTTNPRSKDESWLSNSFSTYVILHSETDMDVINDRFQDMVIKYAATEFFQYIGVSMEDFIAQGNRYNYFLQPLTDIHLNPSIENMLKASNDPKYLKIFGAIGVLILVIGGINFMNLATAQAMRRSKEVGIKKVSGSSRGLLMTQFLTETVILSFLAMLLAIGITEISLPYINSILDVNLQIGYLSQWYTLPSMILIAVIIGLLAGSYPAFYLSSFNPVRVLKGKATNGRGNITLRSALTTVQFAISITLIVGTLIMHRQIQYMLNKDLGFNKEQVIVIRRASVLGDKISGFKNELNNIAGVVSVSASTAVPGRNNNNNGYVIQERPEESFIMQTNWVDYDYLTTYGMELADGRFFDPEYLTDRNACLLNQRASREFLLENPLQTRVSSGDNELGFMPVIGIVRDFHFESLRNDIRPYIIRFKNENQNWGYVSVRLAQGRPDETIEAIENVWSSFTAHEPMLYFFMDQDFDRLYQEEKQNASLSVLFTILAIIIASLGLYGLTSFTVAQRTKEIGVRKTFGASITNIWLMVVKEIMILVGISTAVAWPLVYWVASNWLQNYYYRINLSPMDFLKGFIIASAIALITISYRTVRAAKLNPSISLRYE